MMSGSQPMLPEQIAEELEQAEELDRDAERAHVALEEAARAALASSDGVEADEVDKPSLVDRIKDLLEGEDETAPEVRPAEA